MKEKLEYLYELIDELASDGHWEANKLHLEERKLRISAPQFIIDLFHQALALKGMAINHSVGTHKGITFVPTFEMEISVWSIEYPLYPKRSILIKVPLSKGIQVGNDKYDKIIINLQPLFDRFTPSANPQAN